MIRAKQRIIEGWMGPTMAKCTQAAEGLSRHNYRGNQSHQTSQFKQTLQPYHKQFPSRIQFSFAKLFIKKTKHPKHPKEHHMPVVFGIQWPCTCLRPALLWLVSCLHLQGRAGLVSNTSWLHLQCQSGTEHSGCLAI